MFLKLTTDGKNLMKTPYGDRGSSFVSKGGGGVISHCPVAMYKITKIVYNQSRQ